MNQGTDGLLYRNAAVPDCRGLPATNSFPQGPRRNLVMSECTAALYGGPSESASKTNDPPCDLKYNEYSLPRACQVIMY